MRKLVLTTAILAGFGGIAVAQDATAPDMFRTAPDPTQLRASDFIGMRIYALETASDTAEYAGKQQDWNDIGEVNDVILSRDGKVDSVLVDIGGFLGMGERQVAVNMAAIRFVGDASTADVPEDFFLVMTAPRAVLEAAPEYTGGNTATGTAAATAPSTDTRREPIVRDGFVAADGDYLARAKLEGAGVYDATDALIGEVASVVMSADGKVTQAVIDVGGFLGIGEKPVALNLADIDILRNEAGDEVRVYLNKTKEQLDAMPTFAG